MAKRKIGNSHTTICITWNDKDMFRTFAKLVKKTKNGNMYESDSVIFNNLNYLMKVMNHHMKHTLEKLLLKNMSSKIKIS